MPHSKPEYRWRRGGGEETIQQIAAEYESHPTQVLDWKKILADGLPQAFESKRGGRSGRDDFERAGQELHSKIGELTVKLDFFVKKASNSACEACHAAADLEVVTVETHLGLIQGAELPEVRR